MINVAVRVDNFREARFEWFGAIAANSDDRVELSTNWMSRVTYCTLTDEALILDAAYGRYKHRYRYTVTCFYLNYRHLINLTLSK
jgi:hypothetical protein